MTQLATILRKADAGEKVADIATAVALRPGAVYALLREHRPERERSSRTRTSELPAKIRGLAAAGIVPSRIAFLLSVTRAYVYRILAEET